MAGDELVDLVDDHDRVVGDASVRRCLKEGLLHRAVAVLVIRRSGKIVLQQRSVRDVWHPGLWTISCTGHVRKGESYEVAAVRELREELGLRSRVEAVKKYRLPAISDRGLSEVEWVTLFTCKTDEPCTVDPVELEAVTEVAGPKIQKVLHEWPLTPDARLILADYFRSKSQNGGHD